MALLVLSSIRRRGRCPAARWHGDADDDDGLAALASAAGPVVMSLGAAAATLGVGFDLLGGAIGNAMVKNDQRAAVTRTDMDILAVG